MAIEMVLNRKKLRESLRRLNISFAQFDFLLLMSFWSGYGYRVGLEICGDELVVIIDT